MGNKRDEGIKSKEEIKEIIIQHKKVLQERFKVKSIAIFGSYATDEQDKNSDVDILVEFNEPVGFLFFYLEDYLEQILGVEVDLVTYDAIKPKRRKYIVENLIFA